MKIHLSILAFLFFTVSALAGGGQHFTAIIEPNDEPLFVDVPAGRLFTVINFVQEGGITTDAQGQATINRGHVVLSLPDGNASRILAASVVGEEREPQKPFIVAGYVGISVYPIPAAKLVITYRIGDD